jgi:hypothetical protein
MEAKRLLEMKRFIAPISLIFLISLIGCVNKSQKMQNDSLSKLEIYPRKDSIITPEGNYLVFLYITDSSYLIKWGDSSKFIVTSDTIEVLGSGTLQITESNKTAILLKQSCGTNCQLGVILSLSPVIYKKYTFIEASDLTDNLIAYIPEATDSFLVIENFVTGEKKIINETNLCPAAFKGECIDSISIVNKQLYIRWQGAKWSRKQQDTKERIYNLDI